MGYARRRRLGRGRRHVRFIEEIVHRTRWPCACRIAAAPTAVARGTGALGTRRGGIDLGQIEMAARNFQLDQFFDIEQKTLFVGCEKSNRSEEHTSELQSLMRISYAVFCLKKKKQLQYISAYN